MYIYNRVLMELSKNVRLKNKATNLVKLSYFTEDKYLRNYIIQWKQVLLNAEMYRERNLSAQCRKCLNENDHIRQQLIDYCNACIMTQKPEWQILAERHGWRSPDGW